MSTRWQRILLLIPLLLILLPFLIWPALFGLFASVTNYAPAQANLLHIYFGNRFEDEALCAFYF